MFVVLECLGQIISSAFSVGPIPGSGVLSLLFCYSKLYNSVMISVIVKIRLSWFEKKELNPKEFITSKSNENVSCHKTE
jgi:hypothetical protein